MVFWLMILAIRDERRAMVQTWIGSSRTSDGGSVEMTLLVSGATHKRIKI